MCSRSNFLSLTDHFKHLFFPQVHNHPGFNYLAWYWVIPYFSPVYSANSLLIIALPWTLSFPAPGQKVCQSKVIVTA